MRSGATVAACFGNLSWLDLWGWDVTKCNSEHVAQAIAAERGQVYGLCVHDGKFYVGSAEQLAKIGCVNVKGGA